MFLNTPRSIRERTFQMLFILNVSNISVIYQMYHTITIIVRFKKCKPINYHMLGLTTRLRKRMNAFVINFITLREIVLKFKNHRSFIFITFYKSFDLLNK